MKSDLYHIKLINQPFDDNGIVLKDTAFLVSFTFTISLGLHATFTHTHTRTHTHTHSECKLFISSLYVEFWETKRMMDVRCVSMA